MSRVPGVPASRAASAPASPTPTAPAPLPPERPTSPPGFDTEPAPAGRDPAPDEPPTDGNEYSLRTEAVAPRPALFVPAHTSTVFSPTPSRATARVDDEDDTRPFLTGAAALFPWLYPNCLYWLWLSILSSLFMAAIALTLFVMGLMPFHLASMLMVCVALAGYILAAFESIIEQTAHGEDRMQGLPELGWGEILAPFFRAFGAMCGAIGVPVALSYLLCRWLPIPGLLMVLPGAAVAYLLFPVFLITNLIDETFVPLKSIPDVIVRVSKRIGHFALFLVIIGWLSMVLAGGVALVFYWSIVAGLFALGPVTTTWLMYYGHLLGRLGEKLMELE